MTERIIKSKERSSEGENRRSRMRKINNFPVYTGVDPETQDVFRLVALETFRRLEERARIEDGKERTILDVLCDVSLRLTGYDPRLPEYVNGRDVDFLLWEEWFDEPYDDGVPADLITHWMKDAGWALIDTFHYFRNRKIYDPPFADVRRVVQYYLAEIDRPKWKPTLEQELAELLKWNMLFRRVLKEAVDMEETEHWKLTSALGIGNEKFSSLVRLFLRKYGREGVKRLTDRGWNGEDRPGSSSQKVVGGTSRRGNKRVRERVRDGAR